MKGLRTERDHALVGLTEQGGIWISCRLKGREKPRAKREMRKQQEAGDEKERKWEEKRAEEKKIEPKRTLIASTGGESGRPRVGESNWRIWREGVSERRRPLGRS